MGSSGFSSFPTARSHRELRGTPGRGEQYLVEAGPTIHYLSAERDIAALSGEFSPATGMLAVGNPDYNALTPGAIGTAVASGQA